MRKRNIHILIIAGLFGILTWVSVSLREQYVVTVSVPLLLEDIPDGYAVKSPLPRELQLRFRGDGWRLAGLLMGGEPKLAFSAAAQTSRRPLAYNDVAERMRLTPGIQLIDVKPESVRIDLDRAGRKRVPVTLDCVASFREGYGQVGPTIVDPDSITIVGAESLLKGIGSWTTAQRVFENLRAPLDERIPLASPGPYLLAFSVPDVRISITVEPFAEKVFAGVPVDVTDVPSNREVILIPPRIELVVRAGIKQLSALSAVDFRVTTDYARITADSMGAVDTDIAAPAGVQIVGKRPERVQYIVRKPL
ncbi:MAG: hypothetical protein AB1428_10160 [Bacteroidota bacterium]